MSKKCVLFLRVSTVKQDYNQQIGRLKSAAAEYGYINDEDFIIIGAKESGRKLSEEERETITHLQSVIETEDIDLTILFEISRLARRMDVLIAIRDTLLAKRIQLVCLNPSFTLLTEDRTKLKQDSNLVFNLFGAIAENEAIILQDRVLKAFEDKAAKGEIVGGTMPFGYRFDENKRLVEYKEEADIVRYIYDSYEAGLSQVKIARKLKEKYPTHNFLLSRVTQILNNELYTGIKRPAGTVATNRAGKVYKTYKYDRQYPPLITVEQFQKCREIADNNRNERTPSIHLYYGYKLIKCPECGGFWGGGSQRNSYHCRNAYNDSIRDVSNFGKVHCKYKHAISINLMDSLLWHVASTLHAKYLLQDTSQTRKEYEAKLKEVQEQLDYTIKQLSGIKFKKERIADGYADGAYTKEKYREKLAKVDEESQSLNANRVRYEHQIEQINELIAGLQTKNLTLNGEISVNLLSDLGDLVTEIRDKTTDDQLRYDIIHKHIMEVYIYYSTADIDIQQIGRKARVKLERIEIRKYQGDPINYYYIPHYNRLYYENPIEHIDTLIQIDYLKRFGDIRRVRAKEKRAKKREEFNAQFQGYYTPNEVMAIYGVPRSVAAHLYDRYGVPVEHFSKFCAYKIKDVENFMEKYKAMGTLTTIDVTKILSIGKAEVWEAVNSGELKATKYRNRFYFTEEDVESYKKRIGK